MPASMNGSRSALTELCSCQAAPVEAAWFPRWFLAAAEYVLSQSRLQTALRPEAISSLKVVSKADKKLGDSNHVTVRGRAVLRESAFASLCMALFLGISWAVAGAQTATTTTLAVSPANAANGSGFPMTAAETAGATSLTGGTVTFRDTYNSITQTLGTIQVESANGGTKKGSAILHLQLGGIGMHSIVATFNGIKNNLASS